MGANLPAIEGGKPIRDDFLPFFKPSIDKSDVESVVRTLESGWLTLGPQTRTFEEELKRYLDVRNALVVSSCSAAMFLALKARGIGAGDEVVTSSLSFASTVHAIIHTGAKPVLTDIETESFGPSPEDFEKRSTKRTKAFMPVHFAGQACFIEQIKAVADSIKAFVLEDAAHSFGGTRNGVRVGGIGDATAFSFYATKNLTCGEGGCLTTDDDALAERARALSYHGMSLDSWDRYSHRGSWYYDVNVAGYKFNINDILSSLGVSQLKRVDDFLAKRKLVAEKFMERFDDSPYFTLPKTLRGNHHAWHLFVVMLNIERMTIDRDRFAKAMTAENIGCSVHFIPIYKHSFFKPYVDKGARFPRCDWYYSRCISLPIFPDMSDSDIDDVVNAMTRIATYYSKQ